jgi:transposase
MTDPPITRFIFSDTRFAWIWLIARLYMSYTWITSGWGKFNNPAWLNTGDALKGYWVNALKAGGVARLLARDHGGGQPPQVRGSALTELQAGLKTGRWKRAKEIQQWLHQRHATQLTVQGVYYWLGKLGGVLKVPRKTHAQKDAAAGAEFQRTLCTQLKNLNVAGGKRVRVWVADEHRYGLIPVVRRCWTLRGLRPTAPYQTKYQWGYLYSALEVDGENAAEFACLPGVSA